MKPEDEFVLVDDIIYKVEEVMEHYVDGFNKPYKKLRMKTTKCISDVDDIIANLDDDLENRAYNYRGIRYLLSDSVNGEFIFTQALPSIFSMPINLKYSGGGKLMKVEELPCPPTTTAFIRNLKNENPPRTQ